MTRNRARKQAARRRAALTGERYVVAQRAVADEVPLPSQPRGLHALAHRMPGVPAHIDGGLQARAPRIRPSTAARRRHRHPQRHHGEPRVLIGWQNWIAGRLGAR